MDGLNNIAKQQTQVSTETQGRASQQTQQAQVQEASVAKQRQEDTSQAPQKITTNEQAQQLVDQLNEALAPMSTSLKFGFDNSEDVFYVSVIESESSKMIRRFPAEQAADFLPKMQEVTGLLFDSKG